MNESHIDSFPHLSDFMEKHLSENTGVISDEMFEELKILIEAFDGYAPTSDADYKATLQKLSLREEENHVLKLELNEIQKRLKEQLDVNQKTRQTIIESKNQHLEIANEHSDRITELEGELERIKTENETIKREQNRMRDKIKSKEQEVEQFEQKYVALSDRFEREVSSKQTFHSQNMQDLTDLKGLLDQKKEECSKLNKDLNKLKTKIAKLSSSNKTLMQSIKANTSIQNGLEKEIGQIKKSHDEYVKETGAKLSSYAKMVEDLEKELSKPNPAVIKFIEIVKTRPEIIKNKEEVAIDTLSGNENSGQPGLELGHLNDYSHFWQSNRQIEPIDLHEFGNQNSFNYEAIDHDDFYTKLNSNLASDFPIVSDQQTFALTKKASHEFVQILEHSDRHESMDEDDDPTVVFPKSKARKTQFAEQEIELDFEKKIDEALSKSRTIGQRISLITPASDIDKNTVKQKLEEQIAQRKSTMPSYRFDATDTLRYNYADPSLAQGLQSQVEFNEPPVPIPQMPSEVRLSQIREDMAIDIENFLVLIEFLENYLVGPKNPTTLTLTDFDKANLIRKFEESEKKNFRKFFVIIMKYFLEYINFEEGQIQNLIHSKSYLEIKVDNMKSEFNFLLKNFIDKNQKSQQFLNDLNVNFTHLKESNRNRLFNYREGLSKRDIIVEQKRRASNNTADKQNKGRNTDNETSANKKPGNTSKNEKQTEKKHSSPNVKDKTDKTKLRDRTSLDAISEFDSKTENHSIKKTNARVNESKAKETKEEPKDESIWSKFLSTVSFK